MVNKSVLLLSLVLVLTLPGAVRAQGPQPMHSDPTWHASYFDNIYLSGSPVLEREEFSIDYRWGSGSPDPAVRADRFSVRWVRYVDAPPGRYRFTATSDDGIRVFLDSVAIIDRWYDQGVTTTSVDRNLTAGHHLLVIEYYENSGNAVAHFSWEPLEEIANWRGAYFNNRNLEGPPVLVRDDEKIDFAWGEGSPARGTVNADRFSVRWTRQLNLKAGSYRFSMTVDDGGRLWVNNHLLIDAWKDQQPTTYHGVIHVPAGGIPVKMEFYDNSGAATARLSWARTDGDPGGVVIVDDGDRGFVKGGAVRSWRSQAEGYGGDLLWTKNNDQVRANYNWVRWYPKLSARRYEVFVYIPHRFTTTAKARYWVSHANGVTLKIVNQSKYSNQWVSLGTYTFRSSDKDYVSLSDVTYEPYLSRLIAFDAVKWVPR